MAYQSGRNLLVAQKLETTFGVAAGQTGAKVIRVNSGGINLNKEPINSGENRRDGQITRGRHGSRSVNGQYAGELSLGTWDDFIQAVFRGTFSTVLTVDEATAQMASATLAIGANTITASAGDWIASGLRIGDVIRATDGLVAGNSDRNLRIVGLTATVITVAETLTVEAGPIAAYEFVRPKKLLMGTVPRSFTVEESELDIDGSKVGTGIRWGQLQLQLQPNGMVMITVTAVGRDMEIRDGVQAPYFTDPVATTSLAMTAVEAMIRLGTEDILDITSLDLTVNLNASGVPVVGSNVTPEVFTNQANVTGSITALKKDVARSQAFLDEDEFSLHMLFTENESDPQDFCSFFVGNLTLANITESELGADNGRTQQITLLIGKDERGGAYDPTTVKYQTSSAA